MAGRRTKLTPDVQRTICAALKAGNYEVAACELAGIDPSTFYRWLQRGERETRGAFREFRDAVSRAIAGSEVGLVADWRAGAKKDWRGARDMLARRFPERWGPTTRIEHAGKDGGPIETVTMTPDEAIAIMRARRQLLDAADAGEDESS